MEGWPCGFILHNKIQAIRLNFFASSDHHEFGPEELEKGVIKLKDMKTGEESLTEDTNAGQ